MPASLRAIARQVNDPESLGDALDDLIGTRPEPPMLLALGEPTHGFGAVPGNRELVEWLRAYNADRPPQHRVRFYGFDPPVEYAGAPSPRRALNSVIGFLPTALRPVRDIDALLGEDADWSNPAAMYDPAASIGGSDRAAIRELSKGY